MLQKGSKSFWGQVKSEEDGSGKEQVERVAERERERARARERWFRGG